MDNFQKMIINELQKYDSSETPEIKPFASNKTSGDHYYTINYRGMDHICSLCQRKMHIKNKRIRQIKTCIDHVLIVMNIEFYTHQCPQCKKVFSMFGKIKSHYLPPIRNEVIRRYQMKYSRDKIADDLELKKTTVTEIIEDYRTKKITHRFVIETKNDLFGRFFICYLIILILSVYRHLKRLYRLSGPHREHSARQGCRLWA